MEEEDYDFDYISEEEEVEGQQVLISNRFYQSKDIIEENREKALDGFREVLSMELEIGPWGIKALKQIVKLLFLAEKYKEMQIEYNKFVKYIGIVPQNVSEKCVKSLLDFVSSRAPHTPPAQQMLEEFYKKTLEALQTAKNERLWFRTNVHLANLCFQHLEFGKLSHILKMLHQSCKRSDGSDDSKKSLQLLEIYSLEIQVHTITKNNKKLKELFEKAIGVKSGMADPRVIGIIRECGGKMYMMENDWENAHKNFYQAFLSYNEFGSPRRISCLQYIVLVNMLMMTNVDPLGMVEAQKLKDDESIQPLVHLLEAYRNGHKFEAILRENEEAIMNDDLMSLHINQLLKTTRTQVLLKILKPYTRVHIHFLAQELNIKDEEVEDLLICLILDKKINGSIDQVNSILILDSTKKSDATKNYDAIGQWKEQLDNIKSSIFNKIS